MTFIPNHRPGAHSDEMLKSLNVCSFAEPENVNALEQVNMVKKVDFHSADPTKVFKKFVNVRKYEKRINNLSWTPVTNDYSIACTAFLLPARSYADGNDLGTLHVRYYVDFKQTVV